MGRLYQEYLKSKNQNAEMLYLFKSGIFYIALEDDALLLSEQLNFKLTDFGNQVKCGFPQTKLNYYLSKLRDKNISYKVIEDTTNKDKIANYNTIEDTINKDKITNYNTIEDTINKNKIANYNTIEDVTNEEGTSNHNIAHIELLYEIANIDINNLTLKNSFDTLYELHLKAKTIIGGNKNG